MKMKRKSAKASTKPCNQMIWSVHFNNSLNNALRIWYIFNRIIEVHALNHLTLSSNVNTGEATTVQKSKFLENKFLWSIWLKRHLPYIIVIVLRCSTDTITLRSFTFIMHVTPCKKGVMRSPIDSTQRPLQSLFNLGSSPPSQVGLRGLF